MVDRENLIKRISTLGEALEKAKLEVTRLQREFDEAVNQYSSGVSAPVIQDNISGSVKDRIILITKASPHSAFTVDEVMKEIKFSHRGTVGATLSTLVKKGILEKRGTNTYGWKRLG